MVRLPIRYNKKHVKTYSSLQRKALRRKRAVATPVLWDGYNFQLVMRKNPDDCKDEPILYWMTSLSNAIAASKLYRKRWKIERCRPRDVLQMPEDEWLQFPTDELQTSRKDWVTACCNRICLRALSLGRHPAAQADQS